MYHWLVIGCVWTVLSGCASYVKGVGDVVAVMRASSNDKTINERLDPRFSYLRIGVGKRFTFLVLGYVDPSQQGPIEIWYGAGGEVLRLQNSRVLGTAGMPVDWSNVRLSANLAWTDSKADFSYSRTRDVMPGYDYGIFDALSVTPIDPPKKSALVKVSSSSLSWYEERSSSIRHLPPARYAVSHVDGHALVMYGEQCLSESFCLSWQRWSPPTDGQAHAN